VRGLPSVVPMVEEKNKGGAHRGLGKKVARHERAGAALRLAVGVVLVLVAVDDEDAIGDTSAAVEDPVLASLPSMVRGT
jgi:hypothetical protein